VSVLTNSKKLWVSLRVGRLSILREA
jgi:hypothetical protein